MSLCSVIVPAHNSERFIRQTLKSALSQTYPNIEVIVIDDGSTDKTSEVIRSSGQSLRHFQQDNRGPAAARNLAIRKATGDYIAMLDADDVWLPHRLERMIQFLEENPDIGFATSDAFLVRGEKESLQTYYGSLAKDMPFHHKDQLYWITQYNFVLTMCVIRRKLFDHHGFFDEALPWGVEDWDLWIRFIAGGERVGFVAEPLGYYRVRQGSLSGQETPRYSDAISVLEKVQATLAHAAIESVRGRLEYLKGWRALLEDNIPEAVALFRSVARDSKTPRKTRMTAQAASIWPKLAQRLQIRRFGARYTEP